MKTISIAFTCLFSLLILQGCEDSVVTNHMAKFNNGVSWTQQSLTLNTVLGEKSEGYVKLEYELAAPSGDYALAAVVRSGGATARSSMSCGVGQSEGVKEIFLAIGEAPQKRVGHDFPMTGAISCSLENLPSGMYLAKLYIDDVYLDSIEFNPTSNTSLKAQGLVGFGGYSANNNVNVKSFHFSDELPY